jgi:hypothetical protein
MNGDFTILNKNILSFSAIIIQISTLKHKIIKAVSNSLYSSVNTSYDNAVSVRVLRGVECDGNTTV